MNRELVRKTALGGITSNPIFVLVLGMCPVIALSNTIANAFWLGVCTFVVLVLSNILISALRKMIPDKVRIPCYIIIIASLVTITDMFAERFLDQALYENIATGIKLIVVNCIILGRAEAFARNNTVGYAALDGVSMGVGFVAGILLLAAFRELMWNVLGIYIFFLTQGGFLALAIVMAVFNYFYSLANRFNQRRLMEVA